MKCILFLVEEFSEWNDQCQQCKFFKKCCVQAEKEQLVNQTGDNFPQYDTIHLRMIINQERSNMIEKFILAEQGRITKDDIIDFIIDIELYNKLCKRKKINK